MTLSLKIKILIGGCKNNLQNCNYQDDILRMIFECVSNMFFLMFSICYFNLRKEDIYGNCKK